MKNIQTNRRSSTLESLSTGLLMLICLSCEFILCFLHRIHEALLDLVEDDDAEGEEEGHEGEAVGEPAPADELAGGEEAVFEGLDDRGDGVKVHEEVDVEAGDDLALHEAERVDDRGGVHPELYDEGEEDLEVAVFGGHAGDEDAEAE